MDEKVNPEDVASSVIGLAFLFALGSPLAEVPIDSPAEAVITQVARKCLGTDEFMRRLQELCGGAQAAKQEKLTSSIATLSRFMKKLERLGPQVPTHR